MNVASLRSHIGVVNQEPVLFGKSILENIALGNPDASRAEIEAAAKAANAYDFVTRLPAGFDTLVGARGTQVGRAPSAPNRPRPDSFFSAPFPGLTSSRPPRTLRTLDA